MGLAEEAGLKEEAWLGLNACNDCMAGLSTSLRRLDVFLSTLRA